MMSTHQNIGIWSPSSLDFYGERQYIINRVIKLEIQTIFSLKWFKLLLCCWHRTLSKKTEDRKLCCYSCRPHVRLTRLRYWLTGWIWILISWFDAAAGDRGEAGIWPFPGVGTETPHALVAWDIAHWKTTPFRSCLISPLNFAPTFAMWNSPHNRDDWTARVCLPTGFPTLMAAVMEWWGCKWACNERQRWWGGAEKAAAWGAVVHLLLRPE